MASLDPGLQALRRSFRRKVVELASAVRQAENKVPDPYATRAKMIFTDYALRIIIVVRNA
jgi:hypothetical protein